MDILRLTAKVARSGGEVTPRGNSWTAAAPLASPVQSDTVQRQFADLSSPDLGADRLVTARYLEVIECRLHRTRTPRRAPFFCRDPAGMGAVAVAVLRVVAGADASQMVFMVVK